MSDHDDLARRLCDLGNQPVPDDVRTRHLHAMRHAADASAATTSPRRPFGRAAVAAAALVGFLVGSTGFAMAGALPGPVQGVAHDVLSVVQVDVPDWRNRGECVSAAARGGDRAAKAACPKGGPPDGTPRPEEAPRQEGKPSKPDKAPGPSRDGDPCTGKPPWAGPKTTEEKTAAKAVCPERVADDDADNDDVDEDPGAATEQPPGS